MKLIRIGGNVHYVKDYQPKRKPSLIGRLMALVVRHV
jgi:hypothetical protein